MCYKLPCHPQHNHHMLFVSLLSYLYIDGVIIFLASFFLVPFSLPFSLIFPFSVFPVCLTVCLSVCIRWRVRATERAKGIPWVCSWRWWWRDRYLLHRTTTKDITIATGLSNPTSFSPTMYLTIFRFLRHHLSTPPFLVTIRWTSWQ